MQREKTKIIISWCLVAICMGVIFWLSSRTADESSKQSGLIVAWFYNHFGENVFTDFVVRKLAHFLEYTGLCFLFNIALLYTRSKKSPFLSILFTSLYAVSDEVHQIFVDGRSFQVSDILVDSCGAILGSIGTMILLLVISKIKNNHKAIDTRTI